jgi:hypothetical protein
MWLRSLRLKVAGNRLQLQQPYPSARLLGSDEDSAVVCQIVAHPAPKQFTPAAAPTASRGRHDGDELFDGILIGDIRATPDLASMSWLTSLAHLSAVKATTRLGLPYWPAIR